MSASELICPYCNAALAGLVHPSAGMRPACPRCGELLPATLVEQLPKEKIPAASPALSPESRPPHHSAPMMPGIPGKKKTVAVILSIMLAVAAVAAVFAYRTRDFRRQNDYRTQKRNEPAPPPGNLEASLLGFLPTRCNVLASVHVAELLKAPATRKLLDDPPLGALLERLRQWSGLKLVDIEQVALGAEVKSKLPQLIVLVHTRQPYQPGKIAAALAPARPTQHRHKQLVRFALPPVGDGLVWCHSERLLVFVLALDAASTDDLDAIPPRPRAGADGLAEALRAVLVQRVPTDSIAWLAGDFHESQPVRDLLALAGIKNAAVDSLLLTRTFALSVQRQDQTTLTGHFFTGDVKSTERLQAQLESLRWPDAVSYKVAGPPPDRTDAQDQWITLQARGDLARWLASWTAK